MCMDENKALVVFQDKKIRRIWHENEWYFSVADIVGVLIDNESPRKYWNKLSQRLREEGSEVVTICHQLKLPAEDGKLRETDCVSTKNAFRIIQSIPSKKAEPFKLWLAKVGYDRVKEIENPELAQDRAKKYYELKGYPEEWIDKRLRGILVRQALTGEWSKREVKKSREYSILTDEIARATFGAGIKEHKKIKGLDPKFKNQNLRDHMTNLELIFTMLGEASTTEIAKKHDAIGFEENKIVAKKGGGIAGGARKELESEIGEDIVSKKNYLDLKKKKLLNR